MFLGLLLFFLAVVWPGSLACAASNWPSLFRGVVVADSTLGVRVVSVDESSQAWLADLRAEDIIIRVNDAEVQTIDEFATLSAQLKGQAAATSMQVFRNGLPMTITVHLYSYPLKREWGIDFVPNYDFRFVEPAVGREYWQRLGRGFEEAGKPAEALDAYLNGLHNMPLDSELGFKASLLFAGLGERALGNQNLREGVVSLGQGIAMMQHLFDYSLTEDQLRQIKEQLQATLRAMRQVKVQKRPTRNYLVGKAS